MTDEQDPVPGAAWPKQQCPSEQVAARIHAVCAKDLRAGRRPLAARARVVRSIALSGALFGLLLTIGWQRHPPQRAVELALAGAFIWGIVQASVILVGLGRSPGRRVHRALRWVMVLAICIAFFLHVTLASESRLSFDGFLHSAQSIRHTLVCGVHALIFGALALAALLVVWRRSDPFSPRLSGAVSGLAGGLVGAVALDMTCPHMEAWHLWIGHALTLAVLVLIGWYAGRRWLAP